MNEEQMRKECAKIQAEWQMGGLAATMYEDFAVELAKRVQAAERERCESLRQALLKCKTCALPTEVKELVNRALRA